jgi:hypothetical protein
LTLGILLGSIWAYYELGWGGFWFWDPVENVSLMPWLALTTLLHCILVLEKKSILTSWVIILSIATFTLSMCGTFLVRSGILNSVHTFANGRWYDKNGTRHYDVTSALIKSMRAGEVDQALVWLAIMLDGGEDPMFIARRLSIFAAEDVGNADPMATVLASSTLTAIEKIGMPEARIHLGQTTTYLASTFKSQAAYHAINEALEYVAENPTIEVPEHLKNYPTNDKKKREINPPHFYRPTDLGVEKRF